MKTSSDNDQSLFHSEQGDKSENTAGEIVTLPPTSAAVLPPTSEGTMPAINQHEEAVAVSEGGGPEAITHNIAQNTEECLENGSTTAPAQSSVLETKVAIAQGKLDATSDNYDETMGESKDQIAGNERVIGVDMKSTEEPIETPEQKLNAPEVKLSSESEKVGTANLASSQWNCTNEEVQEYQKSMSLPGTPVPPGSYIFDSCPSSPALSHSSDLDPDATASWKAWRKSIMILWKQVASHRYASLFLQPVTDEIAPNYSTTVYRSVDLSSMKKNIESGQIRTTAEFRRDLMLMFQNAIMYNYREHDVYKMTMEMQSDVMDQVAQYLATQIMVETTQPPSSKSLRRSTIRRAAFSEKSVDPRLKSPTDIEPRRSRHVPK